MEEKKEEKIETTLKKNKEAKIPTKSGKEYSYQYIDIAQIHEYLESINASYYQYIDRIDGDDYIMTVKIIGGVEQKPLRGSRVVDATLYGVDNPAQKQGSALTYARRYSLLMAFGLATEDNDANDLTISKEVKEPTLEEAQSYVINFGKHKGKLLSEVIKDEWYKNYLANGENEYIKKCIELLTGKKIMTPEEQAEAIQKIVELDSLLLQTNTDRDKFYTYYKVKSNAEMTLEQLTDAIEKLKQKL